MGCEISIIPATAAPAVTVRRFSVTGGTHATFEPRREHDCTGSLLLGAAGLLRGYRAAVHWGAREALGQFGAEPSSERVCVDRNRLTGGGVTAGVDLGIAVAGHWAGESMGRVIELLLEYAPQPPYGTGRPDLADAQTLAAAREALQQAMTGSSAQSR